MLGEKQIFQNYFSPRFLRTSFEVREININFIKENLYIYIYIYIYICCLKCIIVIFAFMHRSNIFLHGKCIITFLLFITRHMKIFYFCKFE